MEHAKLKIGTPMFVTLKELKNNPFSRKTIVLALSEPYNKAKITRCIHANCLLVLLDNRLMIASVIGIIMIAVALVVFNSGPYVQSHDVAYVELRTDKSSYSAGQEVKIAFSLVNDKPGNISVASLGYTLEISGSQGVVLIVTESHSSSEPVSVEASSQAFVGTFVWNQRDMKGNQVPQGDYTIRVHLLDASFQGATEIKIE